ncbi:MAG TPA: CsgG/HfaB family protein [Caulobacteraceae bacterium]|nr:CsgG/HfaB family protein [Caulobacteraceae bacterium]
MKKPAIAGLGAAAALALAASPAMAQYGMDAKRPDGTPPLPQCATPVGTASIQEPERDWWSPLGLGNPESLIKLMASRSNCLRIVDRNGGLAMRNEERALGDSGELQRNSNLGKGQIKAADFAIIPDIADSNSNAGGGALGGALGGLVGGRFGAVLGGISMKQSQAHVLLTLVNIRTTEQEYVAEGTAQKTDIGWGAGGGYAFFGAAGGGYSNTDIGKVISAAYLNAFVDLIGHLQQATPGQAAAEAPTQAYRVTDVATLRKTASASAHVVRSFKVGDMVYPTGAKDGVWWEVDDENGNRGWITSTKISPR